MKNHTQRMPLSGPYPAHTMAKIDAIHAARTLHRTLLHSENHRVALTQWHDFGARLHARALLREHELAAAEIPFGLRQKNRYL